MSKKIRKLSLSYFFALTLLQAIVKHDAFFLQKSASFVAFSDAKTSEPGHHPARGTQVSLERKQGIVQRAIIQSREREQNEVRRPTIFFCSVDTLPCGAFGGDLVGERSR
jgi:hypothetical protein